MIRSQFLTPSEVQGGVAIGTLGVGDIEFYLSRGFDPEQIVTVESNDLNFKCLSKRLSQFRDVKVIHGDLFDTILRFGQDSISAIFFDLYGLQSWDPFLVRHRVKLKCILRKSVHIQVTYPSGRSCVSGFRLRRNNEPGYLKISKNKLQPYTWFKHYLEEISEENCTVQEPVSVQYYGVSSLQRRVAMETFGVSRHYVQPQEYSKGYVIYDSVKERKGIRATQ